MLNRYFKGEDFPVQNYIVKEGQLASQYQWYISFSEEIGRGKKRNLKPVIVSDLSAIGNNKEGIPSWRRINRLCPVIVTDVLWLV
jgi:hypothetical protein